MAKDKLTHRERIERCISGEKTNVTPIALWRHFPVDDQTPDGLAAATAAFQKAYDFDFIKVTPASSFCIKDWGVKDAWKGNPEGTRDYQQFVIHEAEDWLRLPPLDPQKGYLGEQLECLRLLIKEFSPDTPVIQTIFSPLAQAKNLIGKDNLLAHIRQYPDAVHAALKRITAITIDFIAQAKQIGIDGIFYAIQHAQYNLLSDGEFAVFSKPYDLQILETASSLWLNVLHLHGENIMFEKVCDYPVTVINWHDRQTAPDLIAARSFFRGVLCGGLRQWETMVLGTPADVLTEAEDAIQLTENEKFILGTGCVLPIIAPRGNIIAALQATGRKTF